MQYRTLGQTTIQCSTIAFGCWAIGGGTWWGATDDAESIRAIHAALAAGINLIDTAPAYGFGRSEEVVGQALKGRRAQAVVATKCGLWWGDERGGEFFQLDGRVVRRTLAPAVIRAELELSLKRLGTDYIDLYQTHWQTLQPAAEPIAATMDCLLQLKAEGKIRAIGCSNVDVPQLRAYLAAGQLDALQPRYSMLDRAIETTTLPVCREHRVSVLAYSPLEQGLLTGKIGMDRTFKPGEARNGVAWLKPANRQRVLTMLAGWADLTASYHCTMGQLALAWTLAQPGLTYALCGARHADQVAENAAAAAVVLSAADLGRMRRDVEALGPAH